MEITALVVSIISIVIALGSVVYTRRSTHIEEDRRRQERTPLFTCSIEAINDGMAHLLHLRLDTPWPLADITAEIVDGEGVAFTPSQDGVERTSAPIRTATFGRLVLGERATWRIDVADQRAAQIHARLTCTDRRGTSWPVLVSVDTPPRRTRIRVLGG
ncbi:hypothetical protein CcI49_28455 [Frankia sp. CcI49]|uniref:hypothetical protein n=1 Tax=Frankia sp. CcI49 TaxID=1745382 RepID=UPI00097578F8|nr:hypothetical protein [Frankia sp. CcI49]ONH55457.1 hypothetical protein CcI49_28455 [Frankia sp. CcI49]